MRARFVLCAVACLGCSSPVDASHRVELAVAPDAEPAEAETIDPLAPAEERARFVEFRWDFYGCFSSEHVYVEADCRISDGYTEARMSVTDCERFVSAAIDPRFLGSFLEATPDCSSIGSYYYAAVDVRDEALGRTITKRFSYQGGCPPSDEYRRVIQSARELRRRYLPYD